MKMMHLEGAKVTSPDSNSYPDTMEKEGIPIDWPLTPVTVVINGANATINIPKMDDNGRVERFVRFDRLTEIAVTEGKPNGKPVTVVGRSSYLENTVGTTREDAQVTIIVEDWGVCQTC